MFKHHINVLLCEFNSHAGSVCLQPCVLNQPLEVEMLMQFVLIFVLKLPFRLNVYSLLLMGRRWSQALPSGVQ